MKRIIFILAAIAFSSCQEVIDLGLGTVDAQLVIQGNIYDKPGPYYITLATTINFDEPSEYPPVSGATVIISDNHGVVDTLTEKAPGTYETSKITGISGYTYDLTVIIDETAYYTATSTMPDAVVVDSIYLEEAFWGNEEQLTISFRDTEGINNYYRVIEFINGELQTDFHVISDELYDGEKIEYAIMSMENDNGFKTGDSISIWLLCIDEGVYDYFRTAGGDMTQSASPANPASNISNDALGYFNASTVSSKSVVLK